jgi:hypothetical protein
MSASEERGVGDGGAERVEYIWSALFRAHWIGLLLQYGAVIVLSSQE